MASSSGVVTDDSTAAGGRAGVVRGDRDDRRRDFGKLRDRQRRNDHHAREQDRLRADKRKDRTLEEESDHADAIQVEGTTVPQALQAGCGAGATYECFGSMCLPAETGRSVVRDELRTA